jgi:DNA (cytosine-5)-methyltransferase 1
MLSSIEMCAGAGGQALGLEQAGFGHEALIEIESSYCATLKTNRPKWNVLPRSLIGFDATPYKGIDLLAGGLPCPPFSIAGKQLGEKDERNLFPEALRLVDECRPRAIMIENVRGFLGAVFEDYRLQLKAQLYKLGLGYPFNRSYGFIFKGGTMRPAGGFTPGQRHRKTGANNPARY